MSVPNNIVLQRRCNIKTLYSLTSDVTDLKYPVKLYSHPCLQFTVSTLSSILATETPSVPVDT